MGTSPEEFIYLPSSAYFASHDISMRSHCNAAETLCASFQNNDNFSSVYSESSPGWLLKHFHKSFSQTNELYRSSYRAMRSILFWRILLLTITSFPPIRGYFLGPGCDAYGGDIAKALDNFHSSIITAKSSLNAQNDRVEDWFGLLESLFPGLNYSTPYTMQQWMLDPNFQISEETVSLTQTLQST